MVLAITFFLLAFSLTYGQNDFTVQASQGVYLGKTAPLGEIDFLTTNGNPKKDEKKKNWPKEIGNFKGNTVMQNVNPNALPLNGDPVRQYATLTANGDQIQLLVDRDGINSGNSGSVPPDPVGVVGNNHFVQMTNGGGSVLLITDKDGNTVQGPFSSNGFWGSVNSSGAGDPMILWDHLAERWFLLEFGNDFSSMLIAISDTDDPTGQYTAYKLNTPGLPDYPKIAIWPTGYFITTNEFTDDEIPTYVLDREAMLAGNPALNFQRILGMPKFGGTNAFQVASAIHWDGDILPPTDRHMMAVRLVDDAWGVGEDRLEIFEFIPDFDNPNNTSVNGPIQIPTAAFDADLCPGGNIFDCIQQPSGQSMSALQQVIMFRPQYRNFISHETIVLNFSVDVTGGNQAGVRWIELRRTAGQDWSVYQEGTYAPDGRSRFMGAIAMDGGGNIAMGYTLIGDATDGTFPTTAITGRRASDPLGEMSLGELVIGEGQSWNGSQRWGDYAAMTVDPVDQTTFWFTNEYAGTNGDWTTKIASFILRRDTFDMAAQALLTPVAADDLTAAEVVTGRFINAGLDPVSDFSVGFLLDGNLIEKIQIPETLQPDSTLTYTFTNTVDMSEVRNYEFKLFTDLEIDENGFNDTLRINVEKIPRFDVAAEGVNGLELQICDSSREVELVFANAGTEDLLSAVITYSINGGTGTSIDWTGNLATGEEDFVAVTLDGLIDGTNTVSFTVSEPNGVADEKAENDVFSRDFEVILEGIFLELFIQLDNFPIESSWEILDLDGVPIHRGGTYPNAPNGSTITESLCMPEDCFTINFFDSAGDGLCCGFGAGFFELRTDDGFVLARGDEFGGVSTTNFCLPFMCSLEAEVGTNKESAPGANNGSLFVNANSSVGLIEYSIDGGANFTTTPFFSGLAGGDYDVVIRDEQGCTIELTITINTCTLSFTAAVENVSVGGMADGSITITADSPFTPLQYSIDGGSTYQDSPIFENLTEGDYDVVVLDGEECLAAEEVTVDLTVDVQTTVFGQRIEMNPNPTTGLVQIKAIGFSDELIIPTEIIDMTGKIIERGQLTRFNDEHLGIMSVHIYPAGIYFLRLNIEGNDPLFKIIKQ